MEQSLNFFLVTKKQFKSARPAYRPAPSVEGNGKNPLWCRTALISFKIMNIARAASMGGSRRGKARSPVSFAGVLQRVMAKGPAAA